MAETYNIIRFYKSGERETIQEGLTRAAAKQHCSNAASEGEDWFDGWTVEECEECGHDNIHDEKYGCEYEYGDVVRGDNIFAEAGGPCGCGVPREY